MGLSQLETEERDGSPAAGPGRPTGGGDPSFTPTRGSTSGDSLRSHNCPRARGSERAVRTWSPDGEPQLPLAAGYGSCGRAAPGLSGGREN